MGSAGHREGDVKTACCGILTVSDTRSESNDSSGRRIWALIEEAGHRITWYRIVPDEPDAIRKCLVELNQRRVADVVVVTGGTGITRRDRTCEVVGELIERELPGFGELFRMLSFEQIGPAAMLSRATAGVTGRGMIVFALPGSERAVELAVSRLVVPVLGHMVGLVKK